MTLVYDYEEQLRIMAANKLAARSVKLPPPVQRKAIRVQIGLTQREVAEVLFVHPDTFGRWERGDDDPGPQSRKAYADVLEVLGELDNEYGSR